LSQAGAHLVGQLAEIRIFSSRLSVCEPSACCQAAATLGASTGDTTAQTFSADFDLAQLDSL